ncbi:MAG: YidC/Oxa1 family insertase periplasmic-domain containing protein, partial [Balneolaceae bacterium]
TVTGLLLIFMITMAWAFYTMPSEEELEQQRAEQVMQDSIAAAEAQERDQLTEEESDTTEREVDSDTIDRERSRPTLGVFEDTGISDTVRTTVRTSLYEIEFTNLGAGPAKYTLLNHNTWDQEPVQMIMDTTRSAYSLGFLSSQNYNIETDQLLFEPLFDEEEIEVNGSGSQELVYQLNLGDGSRLLYTYTFYGDQYRYDLEIRFDEMESFISDMNVDFGFKSPLNLTELDVQQDALNAASYIFAGGELEKLQLTESGSNELNINGDIEWVSTRSRFFGQYIKPTSGSNGARIMGEITGPVDDPNTVHHYQSSVQSNILNSPVLTYELYSGPLRYYDLREFDENAYDVIEIGYALIQWFADPLVRFLVIPFFAFGSIFIPNYGILIILFGVIIKLLLFPLTQKSFKSMAAMKELQPQMAEIKEKYKDDPQKQQKETIALYKKAKVNPIGGCLPMLLQFPILITLFFFFQNSMIIRQEPFLWATDLSAPDYIINLPFSIPFLGDHIAGFVLLMTAAMFIQTKVTGGMSGMGGGGASAGGPNMKAFTYVLPFILLFVFNNFAAGLSLYYLVYNVLSAAQQVLINKQTKKPDVEVSGTPNSKKKRKGSRQKKK